MKNSNINGCLVEYGSTMDQPQSTELHGFRSRHAVTAFHASRELWDKPIFDSKSFAALPTVGALVEGWLLVVPKSPVLSFARLSSTEFDELNSFVTEVASQLQSAYGPLSVFEHGPSERSSSIGCGVDHAHLHLVPTRCDLLQGAKKLAANIEWKQIPSLDQIRQCASAKHGYWFVQQNFAVKDCFVGICRDGKPISQLFRRVIAEHLGCPNQFDWKQDLNESNIVATIERLANCGTPA